MTEISKSAFADLRGWSRPYVSKLIKQGRIVVTPSGKVDVPATEALLASTADPSKQSVADRHQRERAERGVHAHVTAHAAPSADMQPMAAPGSMPAYQNVRTRREYALALLAEDELAKSRGELVAKADVDRAAFTIGRSIRDGLFSLPPQISGELMGLTDRWEVERVLTGHLRRVLESAERDFKRVPEEDAPGSTEG